MNKDHLLDNVVEKSVRIPFYFLSLAFVAISIISLVGAISWIDRPFPGFLLYKNSSIAEVSLSDWTGGEFGYLETYDKIIKMDGTRVTADQIYKFASSKPIGTPINYTVSRGNEITNVKIPTMRFGLFDFISIFGVVYIVGLIIFSSGATVYFLKPQLLSSKIFFLFCMSMGIWFTSIFDTQSTYLLGSIPFMGWMFAPAFLVYLSFIFPSRNDLLRNDFLLIFPFLPSLLLLIFQVVNFDSQFIWKRVDILTWTYVLVSTLIFIILVSKSYLKPDSSLNNERAKVILLGAFFGFFIPALCALIFTAMGISNLNSLALIVIFFPVSIAYAIVKHKLFNIEVIIQKTLVYSTLTGVVVGVFALMVLGFNMAFAKHGGWRNPGFFLVLSGFLVVALNPLRNRIQSIIDTAFFRKSYDYSRTISELSDAMTSILDIDEIATKIVNTITRTMFVESASLLLFNRDTGNYRVHFTTLDELESIDSSFESVNRLVFLLNRFKREIFREDLLAEHEYISSANELNKLFADLRASLVIPLFFKDELVGILSLGEKKSGLMYSSYDLKLLKTLANQTAIAIENAHAFKLVEDYARKLELSNKELVETQAQLIQAEKMSAVGQLAAGIAHEIRNPLNIIEGARYCISQMARDEGSFSVGKYLDYIKHEIDRTNSLVDRLIRFSKPGTRHFEQVDVNNIIEEIVILLRNQMEDKEIVLVKNLDFQIPKVMGDQNNLWQVFINIIMNSFQAMPGGGELTIETGIDPKSSDKIFISFTDKGVGIKKENLSKIFDPFFTTKDTGTGLGLSVSYKIIDAHGGNIIVFSEESIGTTFIIELPVSQEA
ncbi:ATP-binding protein [Desulfobacterota bacterium AH_259_B03_O07]|nr:ATP-binding protein [Desulfobacterota bacterium AH_259_B03_O07]